MKFFIVFALFVAAANCNPIQVENNNIGDIVTVEVNFNGVFSVVVDEENVDTNVGLSKVGGIANSAKLLELLKTMIGSETSQPKPDSPLSVEPRSPVPIQPAIEV